MNKKKLEYRTRNLSKDYEMKQNFEHGIGLFSVNKITGKVCDCKMKWNKEGTILSCSICGFDGT